MLGRKHGILRQSKMAMERSYKKLQFLEDFPLIFYDDTIKISIFEGFPSLPCWMRRVAWWYFMASPEYVNTWP